MTLQNILEKFDKEFVSVTYPFLGGQRDYWKWTSTQGKEKEMEQINEIKHFIESSIREVLEEIVPEKAKPTDCDFPDGRDGCRCVVSYNKAVDNFYSNIKKVLL